MNLHEEVKEENKVARSVVEAIGISNCVCKREMKQPSQATVDAVRTQPWTKRSKVHYKLTRSCCRLLVCWVYCHDASYDKIAILPIPEKINWYSSCTLFFSTHEFWRHTELNVSTYCEFSVSIAQGTPGGSGKSDSSWGNVPQKIYFGIGIKIESRIGKRTPNILGDYLLFLRAQLGHIASHPEWSNTHFHMPPQPAAPKLLKRTSKSMCKGPLFGQNQRNMECHISPKCPAYWELSCSWLPGSGQRGKWMIWLHLSRLELYSKVGFEQ